MYKETIISIKNIGESTKSKTETINDSKMWLKNLFVREHINDKNMILRHLNGLITQSFPKSEVTGFKDSIKITYNEKDNFTVLHLFFEKSKIIARHNIKSIDHILLPKPNYEFINCIFREIKQFGYYELSKEDDHLQSTCRIELIKEK